MGLSCAYAGVLFILFWSAMRSATIRGILLARSTVSRVASRGPPQDNLARKAIQPKLLFALGESGSTERARTHYFFVGVPVSEHAYILIEYGVEVSTPPYALSLLAPAGTVVSSLHASHICTLHKGLPGRPWSW